MIDACFNGETGRGDGLVTLVATSGSAPANWYEDLEMGLFTSRFLMGAAGLADAEGPVEWDALGAYVTESVTAAALRDSGGAQVPEIDLAAFALPAGEPVAPIAVATARDEALALLASGSEDDAREADRAEWERLSALGDHQGYLDGCGAIRAYRDVAEVHLFAGDPSSDPRVARCDALAARVTDGDRPEDVAGVTFARLDGLAALPACEEAVAAFRRAPLPVPARSLAG